MACRDANAQNVLDLLGNLLVDLPRDRSGGSRKNAHQDLSPGSLLPECSLNECLPSIRRLMKDLLKKSANDFKYQKNLYQTFGQIKDAEKEVGRMKSFLKVSPLFARD